MPTEPSPLMNIVHGLTTIEKLRLRGDSTVAPELEGGMPHVLTAETAMSLMIAQDGLMAAEIFKNPITDGGGVAV